MSDSAPVVAIRRVARGEVIDVVLLSFNQTARILNHLKYLECESFAAMFKPSRLKVLIDVVAASQHPKVIFSAPFNATCGADV